MDSISTLFDTIKDYIFNNWLDLPTSLVIISTILFIYFLIAKIKFKEKTSLDDFFNLSLQGMSLHAGFILIFKVLYYFEDKKVFGVFQDDILYVLLGGLAVIYVSIDAMRKKYMDLKLSSEGNLPPNAT